MSRALNEIVRDLNHLRVDVGVRLHQEDETQNKQGERVEASVCSDLGMNNAVAVWSTMPLVHFEIEIGKDFE